MKPRTTYSNEFVMSIVDLSIKNQRETTNHRYVDALKGTKAVACDLIKIKMASCDMLYNQTRIVEKFAMDMVIDNPSVTSEEHNAHDSTSKRPILTHRGQHGDAG